jgi:hypothetical protein
MSDFELPDCSTWGIWEGKEIEGTTELGVLTLFVRRGNYQKFLDFYERVWFCKEYDNWQNILSTAKSGKSVCLEVTMETLPKVPKDVLESVQIYLKIEAKLKENDHICIGTAFKDEALRIGSGQKVFPEQYKDDRLLEL